MSTRCRKKSGRHLAYKKKTLYAASLQMKQLPYEVLVRPTLEYATLVLATHRHSNNRASATFHITLSTSSVGAMCVNLMWNSLYTRRYIRYVTLFFKIHHRLLCSSLPVIVITADAGTRRQHNHILRTLLATRTTYQQSVYVLCLPLGNTLTGETTR